MLATLHELLIQDESDIHLASFSPLQSRLTAFLDAHTAAYPPLSHNAPLRVTFHIIAGLSMKQTFERDNLAADQIVHAPGISGAVYSYQRLVETMLHYESSEYVETCRSCCDLLETVNPTLVVVDPVLNQALDACRMLKRDYVILAPSSFKEIAGALQPNMAMFWKFPA
jgi:hypothetical protein